MSNQIDMSDCDPKDLTDINLSNENLNNFAFKIDDFKSFDDFEFVLNNQNQNTTNCSNPNDKYAFSSFLTPVNSNDLLTNSLSPLSSKKFKCDQPNCSKSYSLIQHLNTHLFNKHKIDKRILNLSCLDCDEKFSKRSLLIDHLSEIHKKDFSIQKKSFPNLEEFEKFKVKIEKDKNCSFIKRKGSKINVIYDCSRSGKKRLIDSERRKRDYSTTGSSKIDMCCTAFIKIKKTQSGKFENLDDIFKN